MITISRKTTYLTAPLRPDGSVDYLAALNDRCREGVTPENNAAIPFFQAVGPKEIPETIRAEFFRMLGVPPLSAEGPYLPEPKLLVGDDGVPAVPVAWKNWSNEMVEQFEQSLDRPWHRQQYPLIAEFLDANEAILAVLVKGMARPKFYLPLVAMKGEILSNVWILTCLGSSRHVAHVLRARAMQRVAEGNAKDAWQDILAGHRLARLVAQGPFLGDEMLARGLETGRCGAEIVLAHYAGPTSEQLRKCRADLRAFSPLPSVGEVSCYAERLYYLDAVCSVALGKQEASNLAGSAPNQRDRRGDLVADLAAGGRVDWNRVLRAINSRFDQLLKALRKPTFRKRSEALAKLTGEVSTAASRMDDPAYGARLLSPRASAKEIAQQIAEVVVAFEPGIYSACVSDEMSMITHQRLTDFAFALAEYRNDLGDYPASLGELVPRYFPELSKDPFSEQDFHYNRRGKGYILYSVGRNGRDDGGENAAWDDPRWEHETDRSKIPADIAIGTE